MGQFGLRTGAAQAALAPTVGADVATTTPTNSSPYGFTLAQAQAIIANLNALKADNAAMKLQLDEVRATFIDQGKWSGAA